MKITTFALVSIPAVVIGVGLGLGASTQVDVLSLIGEPYSNGRVGNLLISSVPGWSVQQQGDKVRASELRGGGYLLFGPSFAFDEAPAHYKDALRGKPLVRVELLGDIAIYYYASYATSSRNIKIEGFVVRGEIYTPFTGKYSNRRRSVAGVAAMLEGIREVI